MYCFLVADKAVYLYVSESEYDYSLWVEGAAFVSWLSYKQALCHHQPESESFDEPTNADFPKFPYSIILTILFVGSFQLEEEMSPWASKNILPKLVGNYQPGKSRC